MNRVFLQTLLGFLFGAALFCCVVGLMWFMFDANIQRPGR
jgi:hypothetical protein